MTATARSVARETAAPVPAPAARSRVAIDWDDATRDLAALQPAQRTDAAAFPTYDILGIPISVTTLDTASAAIAGWAGDRIGRYVCVRDVHGIVRAQDDAELAAIHRSAAMVTADGMPVVWLGRRAGHAVERTCGPDLMEQVFAGSGETSLKHYLYGGQPGVAAELKRKLGERFPEARVVGLETPTFQKLSDAELHDIAWRIRASGADVVWIGLPTPKREYLMAELAPLVSATLIGVGAAFDFHSGIVQRAPRWMQRAGLEWLHRLVSQPRRLWRRYILMAPRFLWLVATRGATRPTAR